MSNRSLLFLLLFVLAIFLVVKFDVPTNVKIGVTNLIYGDEMRGVKGLRISVDAPNGKVHLRQLERVRVGFLSVHRKVADFPAVRLHELFALHEHPA